MLTLCTTWFGVCFLFFTLNIIVKLDQYFVAIIMENRTQVYINSHFCLGLRLKDSDYCCISFFENYKFAVYTSLLLGLLFCKRRYFLKFLPHLHQFWTITCLFQTLNDDAYDFFHLLDGNLFASLNLFLFEC